MIMNSTRSQFVVCLKNEEYPASLEVRKLYQVLPDPLATSRHYLRVIDESGEDYLYPEDCFLPIELTQLTEDAVLKAS